MGWSDWRIGVSTAERPIRAAQANLDHCTEQNAYNYAAFLPFDSGPEVEVSEGLQVSFRIPVGSRGLVLFQLVRGNAQTAPMHRVGN